jgi:CRISPR-associated protein Csc1
MATFIARCQMTLHDNLYYASHEFGRFYETEKYLHNYGLTYALGLVRPAPSYFNASQEPRYLEELRRERVGSYYVTPAHPLRVDFAFITFKMATIPYYSKARRDSTNRVAYGRAKELASGSMFEFFVFADEQGQLPTWIRLGKWMTKAEVTYKWYEIGSSAAKIVELKRPQLAACTINPLDFPRDRLSAFDIVVMPPASLLSNPRVTGPCCKLAADGTFGDRKQDERYIPLHMSYFGGEVITK